jgi:hypothetical protein
MSNTSNKVSLQSNSSDYVTSGAKAVSGMVPFVGSILAELAGTIIPNQRIDRIVKFAQQLERRLSNLEQEFIRAQLVNEHFNDLLEEGLRQSARSLTDERRAYLASIISTSLSDKNIDYIESKHLMRILDKINDIEIIWLGYYVDKSINTDFKKKHQNIFQLIPLSAGSPQEDRDKVALQNSYKEHLAQLGLLEPRYKIDPKTKSPKYNSSTGIPEISGYDITTLGRLLIRQIDLEIK